MKVEPLRDLPERTFLFATRVVKLCRELDQAPGVSRTLASQLLRSACSVGANVEEGQGSQSRADFTAKYYIACKEARETHYWLRLLAASEVVSATRIAELTDEANQLVAILTSIVKKLGQTRNEWLKNDDAFTLHSSLFTLHSSPFTLHSSLFTLQTA